ncbi:hypothetical protein LINGRAHAP2_LOCUS23594 [Linum grandiflorum]
MRWYIDDDGLPNCSDSIPQSVDRPQIQIEAPTEISNFHSVKSMTTTNSYHKLKICLTGKSSDKNPPLFSPICPRWETPDPDPNRLIPEDAFSDPPTEALARSCDAEALPDGDNSDESLAISS